MGTAFLYCNYYSLCMHRDSFRESLINECQKLFIVDMKSVDSLNSSLSKIKTAGAETLTDMSGVFLIYQIQLKLYRFWSNSSREFSHFRLISSRILVGRYNLKCRMRIFTFKTRYMTFWLLKPFKNVIVSGRSRKKTFIRPCRLVLFISVPSKD